MAHFAQVTPTQNPNLYTVVQVIVAEQDFIDSGAVGDPSTWWKTSYNTYGNVHYAPSPPAAPHTPDGEPPFRANYAGIGYTFDKSVVIDGVVGVFYAPKPYPSWILNENTWLWQPPIEMPQDGKQYIWDEDSVSWILVTPVEKIGG